MKTRIMIDDVIMNIGAFFVIAGGLLLVGLVVGVLANIAASVWIAFSDKFRKICKAESLIFEYRNNREEFLRWKGELDG